MTLSSNNLFAYATNELSQDVFICWFLSFAMPENLNIDPALTACARKFLNMAIKNDLAETDIQVTSIKRQLDHIDILVEINKKWYVIIEDKKFTSEHDEQITKYKKEIQGKHYQDYVYTVYYKIFEESEGNNADVTFNRADMLNLFAPYRTQTSSQIFHDYLQYMEDIETETTAWKNTDIADWNGYQCRGFFSTLHKKYDGWGYVPNKAGGFWGYWWHWWDQDELRQVGIPTDIGKIYLQLENHLKGHHIVVKLARAEHGDKGRIQSFRWQLFNKIKEESQAVNKDIEYTKARFQQGSYMSVGSIEYNRENYEEKMKLMEDVLDKVLQNWGD